MSLTKEYFWNNLSNFANNIAVVDTNANQSYSYNDIGIEVENLLQRLKQRSKGLFFLFTTNNSESIITYLASLQSGSAVLLLDEKLNNEIRSDLVQNYKPDFIITSNNLALEDYTHTFDFHSLKYFKRKKDIEQKIYPGLAVLLSTSGTTGSPKLVKLSYKNIQSNAESISEYLKIDENEKPITTLPFNYSFGLSIINSHLLKGSTIVLTEKTVFFRDFWNLFNEHKCTSFAGVPYTYTMLKRIGFEKIDLPTLKYFTQAGGKLSEEFIKHFNDYAIKNNKRFFVMYGQTEATARITYVPSEKLSNKIGSIGISIPGGELKIINDGVEVNEPNEVGEIVYKGDNVMLGYAETLVDLSKGDELKGVLLTGDLGYKDEDGFFFVTGRMKRFIKIFGLRINLDEVQKMIENHFKISVACTGKDELLKILVHSDDHLTEVKVKEEVMKMYKLNFKSLIVKSTNQIPTNTNGKYDYNKINEMFDGE